TLHCSFFSFICFFPIFLLGFKASIVVDHLWRSVEERGSNSFAVCFHLQIHDLSFSNKRILSEEGETWEIIAALQQLVSPFGKVTEM
ncbi:hypothetical protein VIGAN_02244400, partial [Vigna angularis var. angularis]